MKSVISAGCFLLLNACATQTPVATAPVTVRIKSETATKQLIDDVRNATLAAIEKQAPNAQPVTVTATVFVGYGKSTGPGSGNLTGPIGGYERLTGPVAGNGRSTNLPRTVSSYSDASSHEGSRPGLAFGDFGPDVPRGMPVPSLSPTPWADGCVPTVGGYGMSGGGYFVGGITHSSAKSPIGWMRVSYTIKDANGRVIETKEQWQPADRTRHPIERVFPSLYDSARVADTAAFIASRVAALSH
jgi:hypothetical protein